MFRTLFNLAPSSPEVEANDNTLAPPRRIDLEVRKDQALLISPPTPLKSNSPVGSPKKLKLTRSGIYATMIGPNNRKTLAEYHVDSSERIIDGLAEMAGLADVMEDAPSDQAMEQSGGEMEKD